MIFHSIDYLLFLPAVVVFYYLCSPRWRWMVLLAASCVFYGSWRVEFLALLWFTTLVDYGVARAMPAVEGPVRRKLLLSFSLLCNLGPLAFFKYSALLEGTSIYAIRMGEYSLADVILPLGISFYTFQTLGYTIDIYRGKREPEKHLGIFAVYVMYFPQLLAGPIERSFRLLPQLRQTHHFELRRAAMGAALILVGYFKKLVIADQLGELVPPILSFPEAHTPLAVTMAAFGSIYRYYADLSGYADIAIGSSLIMGITLSQNFNRPFAATSVVEFWQRWHITVTTWFRDYVFLPLARTAKGPWQRPIATLLTTMLIGLWHGATTAWIFAGLVGGVMMVAEGALRRSKPFVTHSTAILRGLGISEGGARWVGRTFNRLVLIAFLIFLGSMVNAPNWSVIFGIWERLIALPGTAITMSASLGTVQISIGLIAAIGMLEIYQWFDSRKSVFERLEQAGAIIAWPFYYAIAASIVVFGAYTSSEFLYFNF